MKNTARIIFLALFSFAFLSCNRNTANQGVSPPAFDVPLTSIPSGDTYIAEKRKEANVYIPPEIQQTNGFEWYIDAWHSGEIIISGYVGTSREVTIPRAINGMPVTVIGEKVFAGKQLTNITIPNSVTSINVCAFSDNFLTVITIPDSVVSIGDGAFMGNQLTSVTIPPSDRWIGKFVFHENPLTSITIGENVSLTRFTMGRDEDTGVIGFDDNSFDLTYISGGSLAGTYTRPNANSRAWTRR
jgi:hypothetical protein